MPEDPSWSSGLVGDCKTSFANFSSLTVDDEGVDAAAFVAFAAAVGVVWIAPVA